MKGRLIGIEVRVVRATRVDRTACSDVAPRDRDDRTSKFIDWIVWDDRSARRLLLGGRGSGHCGGRLWAAGETIAQTLWSS